MRPIQLAVTALTMCLLACAPGGETAGPAAAQAPPAATSPPRVREADPDDPLCAPLLIEPDLGFGTHVVMRRLPDARDMDDLRQVSGLQQLLVALPDWPADYEALRPLHQAPLPEGAEMVVLLPGWPPSHAALDAWNLLGGNVRLIMIVSGPPPDRALMQELNRVRNLERVIAQMQYPDRSGFERLQRPLSFRVLKN